MPCNVGAALRNTLLERLDLPGTDTESLLRAKRLDLIHKLLGRPGLLGSLAPAAFTTLYSSETTTPAKTRLETYYPINPAS